MLRRLTLRGFRSFRAEVVTFENPLFLVGQNGSGKSNLTDAISFLADAMRRPLPEVVKTRGGFPVVAYRRSRSSRPANMGLAVVLNSGESGSPGVRYGFELRAKGSDGDFEMARERCAVTESDGSIFWFDRVKTPRGRPRWDSNVESLAPAVEPNHLVLPLVGGDVRFRAAVDFLSSMQVCRIEPAALKSLSDSGNGARLLPDGGNSANVLREIQRRDPAGAETLRALFHAAVPGTVGLRSRRLGPNSMIEFLQGCDAPRPLRVPAASMSNGALRLLGLLLAVFQRPRASVLAVAEPETTIHPEAMGVVLDALRHAAASTQVVVTTHSPEILDAKWIGDRNLRVVHADGGDSRIDPVSAATRRALRDRLMGAGDLFRAGALHPSEDGATRSSALFSNGAASPA